MCNAFSRGCRPTHAPRQAQPFPLLLRCVEIIEHTGRFDDPIVLGDCAARRVHLGLEDIFPLQDGVAAEDITFVLLALHQCSTSTRAFPPSTRSTLPSGVICLGMSSNRGWLARLAVEAPGIFGTDAVATD